MRTRKEITDAWREDQGLQPYLVIELLLDIRDLLAKDVPHTVPHDKFGPCFNPDCPTCTCKNANA